MNVASLDRFLKPKTRADLFGGLMYVGKVFTIHSWPALESVLSRRKAFFQDIESNIDSIRLDTYLAIVMFFSHVDAAAISTQKILNEANGRGLLEPLSKAQTGLIRKPVQRTNFEEHMKIQFSVLPHAVGAPTEYGTIKQQALPNLFKLRKTRGKIVHPKDLEDLMAFDLSELDGKDINAPMAEYFLQLQKTIVRCARRLAPVETRDSIDLHDQLHTL